MTVTSICDTRGLDKPRIRRESSSIIYSAAAGFDKPRIRRERRQRGRRESELVDKPRIRRERAMNTTEPEPEH